MGAVDVYKERAHAAAVDYDDEDDGWVVKGMCCFFICGDAVSFYM